MELSKIRERDDATLRDEARKAAEQLFRIRFQMKLGQTEGIKRLREIKKDIARSKTIQRERSLGIRGVASTSSAVEADKKTRK